MKKLTLTTAIASLVLSSQAGAWDARGNGALADDREINVAGATAVEKTLIDGLICDVCEDASPGGQIYVYLDANAAGGGAEDRFEFDQDFAIACQVNATNVVIRKNGTGGSASGALPVCETPTTLNTFVTPELQPAGSGNNLGTETVVCSGPNKVVTVVSNLDTETPLQSECGVSDLGPNELLADFTNACDNVTTAFITPFGVMVTKKLRDALQLAQGIRPAAGCAAWGTADDDLDGIVNEEEADNQPSFGDATITSLNTGAIPRWSDIVVFDPNNGGALTPLDQITGLTACGLDPNDSTNYPALDSNGGANACAGTPDNRVTLAHRVTTSGTRAETEVVMNRLNCVTGARNLTVPNPFDFAGPTTMPLNSGSSNMARSMTNLNLGQDVETNQVGSVATDCGSIWAFGHNSLDKVPQGAGKNESAGSRDGYRYIKLDGKLGTLQNVAAGQYRHYGESTIQYLSTRTGPNEETVCDALATTAATGDALGALVNVHDWGTSGLMAQDCVQFSGGGYDESFAATPLTRGGDNCQVAVRSAACPLYIAD